MAAAVTCARPGCGHDHEEHRPPWYSEAPGRCEGGDWSCACRGFLWVDPGGASGSYSAPPAARFRPGVPLTDAEAELLGPEPTDYA